MPYPRCATSSAANECLIDCQTDVETHNAAIAEAERAEAEMERAKCAAITREAAHRDTISKCNSALTAAHERGAAKRAAIAEQTAAERTVIIVATELAAADRATAICPVAQSASSVCAIQGGVLPCSEITVCRRRGVRGGQRGAREQRVRMARGG